MNARIVSDKIEQYRRDMELFEVNFTSSIESNNVTEVVFDTLKFADPLSLIWCIQASSFY